MEVKDVLIQGILTTGSIAQEVLPCIRQLFQDI